MDSKAEDLCIYRYRTALETLETAKLCMENRHYKDAINRGYYAAFYAIKAVLALGADDFKRDVYKRQEGCSSEDRIRCVR